MYMQTILYFNINETLENTEIYTRKPTGIIMKN